jgi:hypothetical protein
MAARVGTAPKSVEFARVNMPVFVSREYVASRVALFISIVTKANLPVGSKSTQPAAAEAEKKGLPVTGVRDPLIGSMLYV